MKFAKILAMAKSKGYAGEETPEAVAAWLAEKSIEVHDSETGQVLDVKTLKVENEPAPAPEPTVFKLEPDAPAPEPKSAKPAQTFQSGKGWGAGPGRGVERSAYAITRRNEKAAYQARINRTKSIKMPGSAFWADPDVAESAGAWFRLTAMKRLGVDSYADQASDRDVVANTLYTKTGSTVGLNLGAALVPQEYMASIIWATEQYGVARKLANMVNMSRDVMTLPRQISIVTMSYVAETVAATAQDQNTDNVTLTAKKVVGLTKQSNELLSDSAINIGEWFGRSYAEAQAIVEDKAYFLGDGTSTYGGNVGCAQALPSGAYVSATGSGWSSYVLSDFNSAIGLVENVRTENLAFACSRQFYLQVMSKLAFAAGGVTAGEIFGGSELSTGADAMFLGFPVYFVQVMPTATAGSEQRPVYFGDFKSASMIGINKELEVAVSAERYFEEDVFAMRGVSRFAVNVHGDGRGSTYGPIVSLTST